MDELNLMMCLAAAEGNADLVRGCLERGADIDARTPEGNTALHLAAASPDAVGAYSTCMLLVERGAKADLRNALGQTPLMLALQHGHTFAASVLLEYLPKRQELDLFSQLLLAIENDDEAECLRLLQAGAEPNTTDRRIKPPLLMAIERGEVGITRLLLQCGADVNAAYEERAEHGTEAPTLTTPLHAAVEGNQPAITRLLREQALRQP